MSVEQAFPKVAYWCLIRCPLCGEEKPVIAQGLVTICKDTKMHPDRGYAFCNCKNIWFTDWANIDPEVDDDPEQKVEVFQWHLDRGNIKNGGYGKNRILIPGKNADKVKAEAERLGFDIGEHDKYETIWLYHKIEHAKDPIGFVKEYADKLVDGGRLFIATPDPYFIDFENIYLWEHWKIREHHIMWDMESLVDEIESNTGLKCAMMMRNTEIADAQERDSHMVFVK